MDNLKSVVEALIFASESAITLNSICNILEGVERTEVRTAIEALSAEYQERSGGIFLEEVAGGYCFRTGSEHAAWIKRLFKIGPPRISRAAMESLSIIAYRQPLTRGELEAIRGVDAGGVLAKLLDRRLIKITGRKETPGRPVVYGTTKEFLETFDLKDLSCLPSLKEITSLEEEYDTEEEFECKSEEQADVQTKVEVEGGTERQGEQAGEQEDSEHEADTVGATCEAAGEGLDSADTDTGQDPDQTEDRDSEDNRAEEERDGGDFSEEDEHDPNQNNTGEEEPV
jgi:segregation and condensation protein B